MDVYKTLHQMRIANFVARKNNQARAKRLSKKK